MERADHGLVGIRLLSISKTSIQRTFGRNSQRSANAISKIPVFTAAYSLSNPLDMRKCLYKLFRYWRCILLILSPSLKPIDIVVLKKLSDVVNVVPVIAKADSLTLEERQAFKERIKEEFAFHNLKMYPYDNDEFDDEERAMNAQIKVFSSYFIKP